MLIVDFSSPPHPESQPHTACSPSCQCINEVGAHVEYFVPDIEIIGLINKDDKACEKAGHEYIYKARPAPFTDDPAKKPYHEYAGDQSAKHIHVHIVHSNVIGFVVLDKGPGLALLFVGRFGGFFK